MNKKITLLAAGLLLSGAINAQTVTNAGMETWRNYTVAGAAYESPTSWYSLDSTLAIEVPNFGLGGTGQKHIFKSTDMHGGSFATKITTRNYGLLGNLPGGIANAAITIDVATTSYALTGGTAVTQRIGTASAYVKYVPGGAGDSASMVVQAVLAGRGANGADSIVGTGITKMAAISAYSQRSVGITYINGSVVPDHIQVAFLSSNLLTGTAVDGSALFVDDVTIANNVGVSQSIFKAAVVSVYPNPATNMINLQSTTNSLLTWEAVSTNGQVVASQSFVNTAIVSLNNLAAGTYFFRVLNENKALIQTGKFQVK